MYIFNKKSLQSIFFKNLFRFLLIMPQILCVYMRMYILTTEILNYFYVYNMLKLLYV